MLLAGALYAAQLVLALHIVRGSKQYRAAEHKGLSPGRAIGVGALAFLFIVPIVNLIGVVAAVITRFVTDAPVEMTAHDTLRMLAEHDIDAAWIVLAGLPVLAAPIIEEVLYRGLIQSAFRQAGAGPWTSIVITSLMFAIMHWTVAEPHAVVSLFFLSLGFGWAYERTNSLLAPIVLHVLFNALNIGFVLLPML